MASMRCASLLFVMALAAAGQKPEEPQPRVVTPGAQCGQPPSDATVLFDGHDLSHWTTREGKAPGCTVVDGVITCKTGAGDLVSKETFRNAQIHLEFDPPYMPQQHSQARGNSGLYLQGRYEIQILDSYRNPTYANGSCGALYAQAAPLVNASRPPEQWQSYDIIFHGPRCEGANLVKKGTVTVLHNGVLVQDHVEIQNTMHGCVEDKLGEPGPLLLQDHNYKGAPFTVMRFRNIWIRNLGE